MEEGPPQGTPATELGLHTKKIVQNLYRDSNNLPL